VGSPIDSYLIMRVAGLFGLVDTNSQTPFEHCGYNIRMLRPNGQRVIPPLEYVMTETEL